MSPLLLRLAAVIAVLIQGTFSDNKACTAKTKADVAFVLDASNSIQRQNFAKVLDYVKNFVDSVEIGPDKVQVGIVHFSQKAEVDMKLNAFKDKTAMKAYIHQNLSGVNGISLGKRTNTSGGLLVMRNKIFNAANGARQGVPRIAIVITDGKPNEDEALTVPNADAAKKANITIYAVGVGQAVKRPTLESIASTPVDAHVFEVEDTDALLQNTFKLFEKVCETAVNNCPGVDNGEGDKPLAEVKTRLNKLITLLHTLDEQCTEKCPKCFRKDPTLRTCHRLVTKKMSWVDAERYCAENYQARLVSVETAAEYEVIRAQMNADQQGQEWWSGGNDLFRRNDLIWAGTGRAVNSTASGILLTGADGNGRCVQLRPQQRDMNAVSCELQLNFICETGF